VNVNDFILYSEYDHTYFVDQGLHEYLRPLIRSTNSSVLLEGYNEQHHRPLSDIKREDKIAVVGSLYPERILLLEYLVNQGFEFEIYGFGLPRGYGNGPLNRFDMKKFLTLEEKSRVFQKSKCVLNSFTPAHLNAINCRVFEAMASGCLPIVSDLPGNRSWIQQKENGILVTIENEFKLAEEIEWAFKNIDFTKKAIVENRKFVEENANYKINMKKIASTYHDLIKIKSTTL
jgi:glycosyltransferase involved in cell wall biosynthesis